MIRRDFLKLVSALIASTQVESKPDNRPIVHLFETSVDEKQIVETSYVGYQPQRAVLTYCPHNETIYNGEKIEFPEAHSACVITHCGVVLENKPMKICKLQHSIYLCEFITPVYAVGGLTIEPEV